MQVNATETAIIWILLRLPNDEFQHLRLNLLSRCGGGHEADDGLIRGANDTAWER